VRTRTILEKAPVALAVIGQEGAGDFVELPRHQRQAGAFLSLAVMKVSQ
jgi:hypothetical protein